MSDYPFRRAARALLTASALLTVHAQALTLEEAQQLAETAQPLLESKRAAIDAAREASVAARQLPDPQLRLGVLNLPVEGPDAYTLGQDFMTMRMVGVMQEFPRRAKRELRGEMLDLEARRAAQELAFSRLQVRREAALAWLDAWSATRALALVQAQQTEAAAQVDTLLIALRNNRASAADVSAARVELELLKDKERMLRGEERAARAMLSRWIGARAEEALPEELPELPMPPSADVLVTHLETHPHLAAFDTQARIAAADAQLANLSRRPDWNIEVSYARRGSAFSDMVSLQVGIDLPILQSKRQNRSIAAKFAQAQSARDMREDNLREMRADALRLHAAWEVAVQRTESYRARILPEARRRLDGALAAYRGGKGSLFEVLAARRMLLDLELEHVMRRAESARAAIALAYLTHASGGQR
jgi:cobalt-zinc-cadmium efflux system outer membrane protein